MSMQALNSPGSRCLHNLAPKPVHVLGFRCGRGDSRGHDPGSGFDSDDGAANRNGPAFRDVPVDVERFFSRVAGTNLRSTTPFWTK